jgi:hypothetical protein
VIKLTTYVWNPNLKLYVYGGSENDSSSLFQDIILVQKKMFFKLLFLPDWKAMTSGLVRPKYFCSTISRYPINCCSMSLEKTSFSLNFVRKSFLWGLVRLGDTSFKVMS